MTSAVAETDINVLYPPEIELMPDEDLFRVNKGDTISIQCIVKAANPSATSITWYHLGRTSHGLTFDISHINQSDEGRLECEAGNGVGHPTKTHTFIHVENDVTSEERTPWSTLQTAAVAASGASVLIILILVVVIVNLCRKLDAPRRKEHGMETNTARRSQHVAVIATSNPAYDHDQAIYENAPKPRRQPQKKQRNRSKHTEHVYEDLGTYDSNQQTGSNEVIYQNA